MPTFEPAPTPEEIRQRCELIQAGWTEAERLRRLRPDWRPQYAIPITGRLARHLEPTEE